MTAFERYKIQAGKDANGSGMKSGQYIDKYILEKNKNRYLPNKEFFVTEYGRTIAETAYKQLAFLLVGKR